jgi:hypothetical protein
VLPESYEKRIQTEKQSLWNSRLKYATRTISIHNREFGADKMPESALGAFPNPGKTCSMSSVGLYGL